VALPVGVVRRRWCHSRVDWSGRREALRRRVSLGVVDTKSPVALLKFGSEAAAVWLVPHARKDRTDLLGEERFVDIVGIFPLMQRLVKLGPPTMNPWIDLQ